MSIIAAGGRLQRGQRAPALLRTARSIPVRPPSSFTSRLGPWGEQEKCQWDTRLWWGAIYFKKWKKKQMHYLIYYLNAYNPNNELIGCKTAHWQRQGTALLVHASPPCSALPAAEQKAKSAPAGTGRGPAPAPGPPHSPHSSCISISGHPLAPCSALQRKAQEGIRAGWPQLGSPGRGPQPECVWGGSLDPSTKSCDGTGCPCTHLRSGSSGSQPPSSSGRSRTCVEGEGTGG